MSLIPYGADDVDDSHSRGYRRRSSSTLTSTTTASQSSNPSPANPAEWTSSQTLGEYPEDYHLHDIHLHILSEDTDEVPLEDITPSLNLLYGYPLMVESVPDAPYGMSGLVDSSPRQRDLIDQFEKLTSQAASISPKREIDADEPPGPSTSASSSRKGSLKRPKSEPTSPGDSFEGNSGEASERSSSTSRDTSQQPTHCVFCYSETKGFHYGAPSCNGCKTFFRRRVMKGEILKCENNDEKCLLERVVEAGKKVSYKVKCPWCRLLRCVGKEADGAMNPMAIEMKRHMKNPLVVVLCERYEKFKLERAGRKPRTPPSQNETQRIIDQLAFAEIKHSELRRSSYNPQLHSGMSLAEIVARAPEYENVQHEVLSIWPGDCERLRALGKVWQYTDLVCSIEYVKTFEFFHTLSAEDKEALLKAIAVPCANLTQAYFSHSNNCDAPINPDGTDTTNNPLAFQNSFLLATLEPIRRLQLTQPEYLLLKALAVCNSDADKISRQAHKLLKAERKKYTSALFDHCFANAASSDSTAPARFQSVLSLTDVLIRQASSQCRQKQVGEINRTGEPIQLFNDLFGNFIDRTENL